MKPPILNEVLKPYFKDQAELTAALELVAKECSKENALRARMFDQMTGAQAEKAKAEMMAQQDLCAGMLIKYTGGGRGNLRAIQEMAIMISPMIQRTMTPAQEIMWHETGMNDQILIEKVNAATSKMEGGMTGMAKKVLDLPNVPPVIRAAAEELLRRHPEK